MVFAVPVGQARHAIAVPGPQARPPAPRSGVHKRNIVAMATENGQDTPPEPSRDPPRPNLADPVEFIDWGGSLPSPRRAALGGLAGLGITLGGNLFGVTSFLLGLDDGRTAGKLRLDALVPVSGFKRCYDPQNGFEFIYPARWLADQQLYRRYAERIERERSLDPLSSAELRRARARRDKYDPSAAFGPPGGSGEDNVSVVVAPIREGFTLQKMGSPEEAAGRFMESIAPEGSGKTATLLKAYSRSDPSDGELYYVMEFIVEAPGKFKRHNLAVYGSRNGLIYTFNAQAGEDTYNNSDLKRQYKIMADSFRMTNSGASAAGFPSRL